MKDVKHLISMINLFRLVLNAELDLEIRKK